MEDWTDPDSWILERLSGEEQALARRIWRESGKELNPRYLRGSWYLSSRHGLLVDEGGVLRCTERGRRFQEEPRGQIVAEIDDHEGVFIILRSLAESGPAKRAAFLTPWTDFCRAHTSFQSDVSIRGSQYERLKNLAERQYALQSGPIYAITDKGLNYLDEFGGQADRGVGEEAQLRHLTKQIALKARQQLEKHLAEMDPYQFERLIQFLLEEMGYRNVETTSPSHDKGVDVVADIELGISSVREVVQVKRRKGSVHRTVLDGLRGSLHRFGAVRGTIITIGGFSKGTESAAFETGAAPITLIDGQKLLDLLIEHNIGISEKTVKYLTFDAGSLPLVVADEAGG